MRNIAVFVLTVIFIAAEGTLAPAGEINLAQTPIVRPTVGAVSTPITHLKYFLGERERFGYNPLYTPAPVTFDLDNVPYIRVGINPEGHDVYGEFTTLGMIQTPDGTGQWLRLTSWLDAIKTRYPSWDGTYSAGVGGDERIIFDSSGDAYMFVNTAYNPSIGVVLLLYSRDKCRTWKVYPLPTSVFSTKLEMPEAYNDTVKAPAIFAWPYGWTGGPVYLILPQKNANGTLSIPAPVILTSDPAAYGTPIQSGMGNSTVTKGNLVHAVYLRNAASPDNSSGTPQYAVTYNRTTGIVSTPVFLGASTSIVPDVHDGPAITIDSQGYLHVILGAHGGQFKYTKSLVPNSTTGGWSAPVLIGATSDPVPEWTYVSLICDPNDTLHVVGRYSGHGYYFGLWYLRKKAGQNWESLGPLVMPFRAYYSNWYHRLTMDRQGRLFLSYMYYGDQYDRGTSTTYEIDAYKAKWPWENPVLVDPVYTFYEGVQGHDPCVIMSDDGGDSWRLALTSSLQVFGANSFDNGLDGWKLDNGTGTNPIQAVSAYTYNGKTITPRTEPTFACSEFASVYKKATRTISPAQAGTFTGYLNMVQNTNIGMVKVTGGGHVFLVLANSIPGVVSYRIDSTETATAIAVTPQTWHRVKFVVNAAGLDGYWNETLLFHSNLATSIASVSFGSEWAAAPCGYDDFSFFPNTTIGGKVVPGEYGGDLQDVLIKIEFRKNGSTVRTERVNLDVDGSFTLAKTDEQGLYDIAVSSYTHLRKTLPNVDLTADPVDLGTINLTGGDVDGDNEVTTSDLATVLLNMDRIGD